MSKKNGKENSKKGKKAPVHVRHPELRTPGQTTRDERVVLNLLRSKDIAGVSVRIQASAEIRSTVERIAASKTALSGAAQQALALSGVTETLGEILTCVSDEKERERVLERLTGTGADAEAMRSRITSLLGNWEVLFRDGESIMNELLNRFLPKEGSDPDPVVRCALSALTGDEKVGEAARELNGHLSVPARVARFRRMLKNDSWIPNAAKSAEKDPCDGAALQKLAEEHTEAGFRAAAALRYLGAWRFLYDELARIRFDLAKTREFIARFTKLPMDADGLALRAAFAEMANCSSFAISLFAARLNVVMADALAREYFEKFFAVPSEEVARWLMDELTIQQQNALAPFMDACLEDRGTHILSTKAQGIRRIMEERRTHRVTEVALLNL